MGNYLLLRNSTIDANETAGMETSFINTTGRCIFLFVSFEKHSCSLCGDGIFRIVLKNESQETSEEALLSGTEIFNSGIKFGQKWMPLFHEFPDGVHKVILEVEQAINPNSFMLDDIEITHCQEMSELFLFSMILTFLLMTLHTHIQISVVMHTSQVFANMNQISKHDLCFHHKVN